MESEIVTVDDRTLVEARIAGLSRRQVAERFGISVAVVRAAEKRFAADASDLACERAIVGEQLSRIAHVVYDRAREGDARAAESMREISRRRSELLGRDAPPPLRLEEGPPHQPPPTTYRIEATA